MQFCSYFDALKNARAYRLVLGKTKAIAGDSLCLKVDNKKQLEKNGDDSLHPFDSDANCVKQELPSFFSLFFFAPK
jgi:hypothetical protein